MNNGGEPVMWVLSEGILHRSVGCMVSPQVWINSGSEHSFAQSDGEIRSVEGRNLVANDDE